MKRVPLRIVVMMTVLMIGQHSVSAVAGQALPEIRDRVQDAASLVLQMLPGDNGIPAESLQTAAAIVVIPASGDAGLISERLADGRWSAPAFIRMAADQPPGEVVLVFTEVDKLKTLEEGRPVDLGATAESGSGLKAYSKAGGRFAPIQLERAVVDVDERLNRAVYGADATARKILLSGQLMANPTVTPFMRALDKVAAPKNVT